MTWQNEFVRLHLSQKESIIAKRLDELGYTGERIRNYIIAIRLRVKLGLIFRHQIKSEWNNKRLNRIYKSYRERVSGRNADLNKSWINKGE